MPNFTNPHGGPWAFKDPFLFTELNALVEQLVMAPNFDQGSAHAPTGDIELSGSMGAGFVFADLFKFTGELDLTDGLTMTTATSGFVAFGKMISVDVRGPLTFKAAPAGPGSAQWESGCSAVFQSGATLTMSSGSTTNITGPSNIRGTMTFKSTANGGPGILAFEPDAQCYFATDCQVLASTDNWGWNSNSVQTHTSGSEVAGTYAQSATVSQTGPFTFASGTTPLLSPARSWTRHATKLAMTTRIADVPSALDDYISPLFDTPIFYLLDALSSTTEHAIYEIEPPPDGSTIASVTIKSTGQNSLANVAELPTYTIVRWQGGLTAAPQAMSIATNDDHDGTSLDWITTHTTTVTVNAHSTIDLAYRYGVLVTFPRKAGGITLGMYFDAKATGTTALIKGT